MEYNYYIHKTSSDDIDSFFNNGLIDYDKSFKIENTMERLEDNVAKDQNLLGIRMRSLRDGDSTVLLIKIPKDYFPHIYRGTNNISIPMPIFKEKEEYSRNLIHYDKYPVLIPNLIQGCYNKEKGFVTNPNFNPLYDPSGLKFGYEQLQGIRNDNPIDYSECMERNKIPMAELYRQDKKESVWDEYVEYFKNKFGIDNPVGSSIVYTKDEIKEMKKSIIKGRLGL